MSGRLDSALRERLFRGPLDALDGGAARRAVLDRLDGASGDPLSVTLYLDAQLALVDDMLHYFDRASMAHSLEVRVPFLDHHLVEFCATIPTSLKVRRLTTKYVLRQAARGLIPTRAIEKPKQGFFNAAVDGWFEAQSGTATKDYLLQSEPRYGAFLEPEEVRRLVQRQATSPNKRRGQLLLSILMLEIWLSRFVPRALQAQPAQAREFVLTS